MTGDFDDEYLAELQEMDQQDRERAKDKGPLTTVGNDEHRQELISKAQQEIAETQKAESKSCRKTYHTSEVPVRPCTSDCLQRGTCKDFLTGRVDDRDLCKPELKQIKKWQVAFRRGDMDSLKGDAGTAAGALYVQIGRLMEVLIDQGLIVDKVSSGQFGETKEKMVHPALKEAVGIIKTLGIDLNSYLLTPRSMKDTPPSVVVSVGVTFSDVQARAVARYSQRLPEVKVITDG